MAKIIKGTVVSSSNNKTITVLVQRSRRHPLYRKNFSTSKRFYVHDEKNHASVGDLVEFSEMTPLSKTKHWKLSKVIEKSSDTLSIDNEAMK